MRVNSSLLILIALYGFILSSCSVRRVNQKEYVTVRDTVITPPIVKMDTTFLFNDRIVYLQDSTNQVTVTLEKVKNNYIRVKAKCEPKKIIVPISKTVTKTKTVTVESFFWKNLSIILLLVIGIFVLYSKFLPRNR